jgi:hypothetical protein
MFEPEWIDAQDQMEYPYALAEALAYKFGCRDEDRAVALQRYKAEAGKLSLVSTGIIERPSCKLLAITGMEDSIFPIEDSFLVTTTGGAKDLIARGERGHMGIRGPRTSCTNGSTPPWAIGPERLRCGAGAPPQAIDQ